MLTQALAGGAAQSGTRSLTCWTATARLPSRHHDDAGDAEAATGGQGRRAAGARTTTRPAAPQCAGAYLAQFDIAGPVAKRLQFFVSVARSHRPGETVLLNALLRDADGRAVSCSR